MTLQEKLQDFATLIRCGDPLDFWLYTEEMHLIDSITEHPVVHTFFERPKINELIADHFSRHTTPLLLTDRAGLMYCVIRTLLPVSDFNFADLALDSSSDDKIFHYVIMGPVLSWLVTEEGVAKLARDLAIPLSWRSDFIHLILDFPFVSLNIFYRYTLLLHFAMTGEKLDRSNIHLVSSGQAPEKSSASKDKTSAVYNTSPTEGSSPVTTNRRRMNVFLAEKELLDHIRTGNLNYMSALNNAGHSVTFIDNPTHNPLEKAKQSCIIFTSLCVRAAIEGGLSPEAAYSLGDTYISDLEHCTNMNDCRAINHAMYDDFVRRIHKLKTDTSCSPQIMECRDYIDAHPEEKLTLHELAGRIGYTDTYLSRKFKQETGISLIDYINRARVNRAKQLLTDPAISVSAIAEQLNFSTVSYFATIFQKFEGMTPQQYRKR